MVNRHRLSIKEMRYECSVRQLLVEIETVSRELNRDTEYSYLLGEREVLEMKNAVLAGTLTLSPLKIVVVEKDDPLQNNFSVLVEFPGLPNLFFSIYVEPEDELVLMALAGLLL